MLTPKGIPPKIIVNGTPVAPINKRKLPAKVDWQSNILKKRASTAAISLSKP